MRKRLPVTIATLAAAMLLGCNAQHREVETSAGEPHAIGPRVSPSGPASMPSMATPLPADRADRIADRVLRAQYRDGFDTAHACWKATYGAGDDAMDYCMRPLPPMSVVEAGSRVVYVATASASDISGDPNYRYGATDPGMFDAYRVVVGDDDTWRLSAASRGMDFGSAGDCGCADADFAAFGPDVHGWVFSSGITEQGQTSSIHSLVAPVDGAFRDVAAIQQYVEGDPSVEYRLALGSSDASDGWYPLTVTKYTNQKQAGSRTARFDAARRQYVNPGTF